MAYGGAYIDPKPLLDWIDRNPGAVRGWATAKEGKFATVQRRITAMRRGARVTFLNADEICCLLGVHMREVFGDDVYFNTPTGELVLAVYDRHRQYCRKGHEKTGDNLYVAPDGSHICRTCRRASKRARAERLAA